MKLPLVHHLHSLSLPMCLSSISLAFYPSLFPSFSSPLSVSHYLCPSLLLASLYLPLISLSSIFLPCFISLIDSLSHSIYPSRHLSLYHHHLYLPPCLYLSHHLLFLCIRLQALASEALQWDPRSLDKRTLSSLAEVFQVIITTSSSPLLSSSYSVLYYSTIIFLFHFIIIIVIYLLV